MTLKWVCTSRLHLITGTSHQSILIFIYIVSMKTDKNECTNDPIDIKMHLTLKRKKEIENSVKLHTQLRNRTNMKIQIYL